MFALQRVLRYLCFNNQLKRMKSKCWVLAALLLAMAYTSCKKDYCVSVVDQQGNICCQRCFDSQQELDVFNATYTATTCAQKCAD